MKILFISENFPPETNAAATRVFERACYWSNWGHDVTVITQAPNFPQGKLHAGYKNRWVQHEEMDGIKVIRVKTFIAPNIGRVLRTLDFISFLPSAFMAGLLASRANVIVATSPQFFSAVAGWMTGFFRRIPFVFELGDIWPASFVAVGIMKKGIIYRLLENLELFLYRQAAAVVALTPAFKRNLVMRGIPPEKIAVVMNGVDAERYQPMSTYVDLAQSWGTSGKFVVGYVGTHGMAHGLHNVLDAAELLRDDDKIRLLFVGDGAERISMLKKVKERNLTNVIMMESQPKNMMPKVWSLCDVALIHLRASPVLAEVIPSKMFEAMAMGLPLLLVSPEGEASNIVNREQTGVWVPPVQPDKLAQAIREMANDPVLCNTLVANALENVPHHSRRRQAEQMLQVLEISAKGWGAKAGCSLFGDIGP
jgi:colanic acid biosynthesis glycosyl transferase WcaI